MQVIQFQELGSAQSSITFSSIPQTFTDLFLVLSARTNRSSQSDWVRLKLNTTIPTTTDRTLRGNGTSVVSESGFYETYIQGNQLTANTFSSSQLYVPNYTSSNNKSWSWDSVTENNGTEALQQITAGLWSFTSAITSLELYLPNATNFLQYTSATLYGITKGSDGTTVVS
jgi:hypothetical protein